MHQAEHLIFAHLEGKTSEASLGVLYGLLIAAEGTNSQINLPRVHDAMRAHFAPKDDAAWFHKLDRIKKAGWDFYAAVADRLSNETQTTGD